MLKSLEIGGFKSFNKKSTLKFDAPISAIVGPNGSGKSNVVEAFKFALGEQSMRSLRGKQGGDLIFAGSRHTPHLNVAFARIIFDNTSRALDLDFNEVVIERSVYRDGANQYLINGSAVRLKDVLELLAGANIGAGSHHIISQGESDRLLKSSLLERRRAVEEALGLSVYKLRKKESEKKLEKTEENVKSVELQRKELAPQLKQLKGEVEKVRRAKQAKENLKELYWQYLKRENEYLKYWRERVEGEKSGIEEKIKEIEDRIKEAEPGEDSESPDAKYAREILEQVKQESADLQKERSQLERELGRLEGQLSYIRRKSEQVNKRAEEASSIKVDFEDIKSDLEQIKELSSQELNKENKEEIHKTLEEINKKARELLSYGAKGEEENREGVQGETEKESAEVEESIKNIKEKLSDLESREAQMKERRSEAEMTLKEVEEHKRDEERKKFELKNEKQRNQYELERVEEEKRQLERSEKNLDSELSEAAFIVGRAIVDLDGEDLKDEEGNPVSVEDIVGEDRGSQNQRKREIEKNKMRLEDIGDPGRISEAEKEYNELKEKDDFLAKELNDLKNSQERLRGFIVELDEQLDSQFKSGMEKINREFQRLFSVLFSGGTAFLKLSSAPVRNKKGEEEGSEEEEEEEKQKGLDISVSLPRKKISGLEMLSGGERVLISMALVFAISQVNPPPFLILDEADAALDEANSKRFADMVEDLSKRSQLILVSHNRETMSRAGVLYGVTMSGYGVSRLLSVKFDEAVEMIER